MLRACAERGIAFVPFFAIAGPSRQSGRRPPEPGPLLAVARRHGATPAQIRLAWTLHQAPNVLAIPGTGSVAHLEENVAAAALRLSPEDLACWTPPGLGVRQAAPARFRRRPAGRVRRRRPRGRRSRRSTRRRRSRRGGRAAPRGVLRWTAAKSRLGSALHDADLDDAGDAGADLDPGLDADRSVGVVEHLDPAHGRQRRPQVAVHALDLFRRRTGAAPARCRRFAGQPCPPSSRLE